MNDNPSDLDQAATAEGLPVAPSAALTIEAARVPLERSLIDKRVVIISAWSIVLAIATGFVAQALVAIIGLVTNISFYGRFSTAFVSPAGNHLGWLVLFIPAIGGIRPYTPRTNGKAERFIQTLLREWASVRLSILGRAPSLACSFGDVECRRRI